MTTRTTVATEKRCPKCGRTFPLTEQYWYFHKTGSRRGKPNGYCRASCHNAYCRKYDKEIVREGARLARRRIQQRDWQRRKEGYDPERYRVSVYEALLGGMTADQVAAEVAARAAS